MGKKKSLGSPLGQVEFRESDFAGMPPGDQAQLSGSLNQLSQQLAATRQMLQDIGRDTLRPEAIDILDLPERRHHHGSEGDHPAGSGSGV